MSPTKFWKQLGLNSRSPLAWYFMVVLVCANLAIFAMLGALLSSYSQASGPAVRSSDAPLFLLPEPALSSEPTSTATRVVAYAATATRTPSPTPPPPPTATSPPPAVNPVQITEPPPEPVEPDIQHVVIISIDGLRPDALALADTPTLDGLKAIGVYSPNAQTVGISETLPSHASMLSGMVPEKHGLVWGLPYIGWPGLTGPTLFSVAHEAGYSTAMVFGKEKLGHLILPNSVDKHFGADVGDTEIKQQAVEFIEAGLSTVLFIHFPDTDRVGHAYGWMSTNQLQSVTFVDGLIGEILAALERGGYLDSTLLIITADHGGHDKVHGDDSPEDRTIPWLAVKPDGPAGVMLTRPINTYDTAATALHALELPLPENWDGQPVMELFELAGSEPH